MSYLRGTSADRAAHRRAGRFLRSPDRSASRPERRAEPGAQRAADPPARQSHRRPGGAARGAGARPRHAVARACGRSLCPGGFALLLIDRSVNDYRTGSGSLGAAQMAQTFQSIELDVAAGVATLTLNRPERLNSFTEAMHAEVRRSARAGARRALDPRPDPHRRGARLLCRAGPDRPQGRGRRWAARPRCLAGDELQPAGAGAARAADPGHLRGERRRGRRGRKPGAEPATS